MSTQPNSFRNQPDERGHFGQFGGRYVAETLMPLILELETAYRAAKADPAFKTEFEDLLEHYVGRPSPLYFAPRLTEALGGAQVWFKRDELNHTGAHKINNCIGQILLAIRMGKTRIIAETGAGQHGVATATVCARFGLPCVIYMGEVDVERQQPNVFRMKLLGAEVVPVSQRLAHAQGRDERGAARLGRERPRHLLHHRHRRRAASLSRAGARLPERDRARGARADPSVAGGRLPDLLVAAIGGGSNAIGLFHPFLDDPDVKMLGVEAAGHGLDNGSTRPASPAARRAFSTATRPTCCRTRTARSPRRTRSAPGSTIPASAPSTPGSRRAAASNTLTRPTPKRSTRSSCSAALRASSPRSNRATPSPPSPSARRRCRRTQIILVNLCGRGDKDIFTVAEALGVEM